LSKRLLDLALDIQQIPAPTFAEGPRAEFVRGQFQKEGLSDVSVDERGNVYARLPGNGDRAPLVMSAHLDTVFPADTDLRITRTPNRVAAPGIGDNSLGVASLPALVWSLREGRISLPGDLWLVADVCEEGLGDLRGMRAVVERFGRDVTAYIIIEGMAYGHIYHRALAVERYLVRFETPGGHSWNDAGVPSAVHELASLVAALAGIPLAAKPRTVLNVGRFTGGTSVNTIAAEASIEVDLRSEDPAALVDLAARLQRMAALYRRDGVTVDVERIGQRPGGEIPADHPLVRLAAESLRLQGVQPSLIIGSTDANIPLSQGIPSIGLGLTTGGGGHTLDEYIETGLIQQGLDHLTEVVTKVWDMQK
jgi:acetylornithine deacetylase/succinyl-diaminopimelate desuccinylase-like protein